MSSLTIAEIVGKLKSAKTKTERIKILKDNDCAAIRGLIRMNFDESLKLALPDGIPPFKKATVPQGFGNTTLKASATGWYVFVKELSPNMKQSKREALFIQLLESLDAKESEILLQAKERTLDLGLTKKVILEVFPGLIQSEGNNNGSKKGATENNNTSSSKSTSQGV
jgi:hypothetical protein